MSTDDAESLRALLERRKHQRSSTEADVPRCPECDTVAEKKAPGGRSHRTYPEPWFCRHGHHFEEPVRENGDSS